MRWGQWLVIASLAVLSSAASAEDQSSLSGFEGRYAAIGGGYGIGAKRTATVYGLMSAAQFDTGNIDGGHFSLSIGADRAWGGAVVGVELAGRLAGEAFDQTKVPPLGFVQTSRDQYSFKNEAGVHLSARAGTVIGGSLVYVKAGLGATRLKEVFSYVDQPVSAPTSAVSAVPLVWSDAAVVGSWRPSVIVGLGVERRFGDFFGRLGVDFEGVSYGTTGANTSSGAVVGYSDGPGLIWFTRATGMVGYRF